MYVVCMGVYRYYLKTYLLKNRKKKQTMCTKGCQASLNNATLAAMVTEGFFPLRFVVDFSVYLRFFLVTMLFSCRIFWTSFLKFMTGVAGLELASTLVFFLHLRRTGASTGTGTFLTSSVATTSKHKRLDGVAAESSASLPKPRFVLDLFVET